MILLVAAVFTLGIAAMSMSAQEVKGTVTNIEADMLTIVDDQGQTLTIKIQDSEMLKELKAGDKVEIKDGKVKKAKSG